MTLVASGGLPISLVSSGGQPVTFITEIGVDDSLAAAATTALGVTPSLYFDFINDRAMVGGADVGRLSSIPNLTGTPAPSASGHRVNSAGTALTITGLNVPFPLTMGIEFTRVTDLGTVERILTLDNGADANRVSFVINTTDTGQTAIAVAGVSQANPLTAAATVGPTYKMAFRAKTDDCNNALNATLGIQDTLATMPATLTNLRIGGTATSTLLPDINVRRVWIIADGSSDAQLQTMTT